MKSVTADRGAIVHFAGFQHLSPGLDGGGSPAFSAGSGDGVTRCGWETFFKAAGARHLALAYDPEDAASARFVPADAAPGGAARPGGLAAAVEHSRRFWRALFPGPTPGP